MSHFIIIKIHLQYRYHLYNFDYFIINFNLNKFFLINYLMKSFYLMINFKKYFFNFIQKYYFNSTNHSYIKIKYTSEISIF